MNVEAHHRDAANGIEGAARTSRGRAAPERSTPRDRRSGETPLSCPVEFRLSRSHEDSHPLLSVPAGRTWGFAPLRRLRLRPEATAPNHRRQVFGPLATWPLDQADTVSTPRRPSERAGVQPRHLGARRLSSGRRRKATQRAGGPLLRRRPGRLGGTGVGKAREVRATHNLSTVSGPSARSREGQREAGDE